MRRFFILLVTLLLGALVLWHFESERRAESSRDGGFAGDATGPASDRTGPDGRGTSLLPRPNGTNPKAPAVIPRPEDVPKEGLASGETAADGSEAEGDKPLIHEGDSVDPSGKLALYKPNLDELGSGASLTAVDTERLDDIGTRYRLIDVIGESFEMANTTPPKRVVATLIHSETAEVDGTHVLQGGESGSDFKADLFAVVIEQLRNTPLAPLTIDAPRIDARFAQRRLRSVEDDLVTFRSRNLRGSGRGLDISMASGALKFGLGASVTVEQSGGRIATIATPTGGELAIVEETPEGSSRRTDPRIVRVTARDGVHAEIRSQNDDPGDRAESQRPVLVDATSIDILLSFAPGEKEPTILSARADGEVRIRRGTDVYRGNTADFSFNALGEVVSVVLEDEPSLGYRLKDETGQELEVEVSGRGPLTARLEEDPTWLEGDPRTIGVTFLGPGRVEAIDRGDTVTFERSLSSLGLEDRSDVTLFIDGDVSVISQQGDLTSDSIDATFSANPEVVRIVSRRTTRIAARDPKKAVTYRLLAEGGLEARKEPGGWFVERAADVVAESFGDDPYRIEAGLIEDVDVAKQTLNATKNVLYRTIWGSAFAPSALVRNQSFVELKGTDDNPVRLDLLPEDMALELEAAETSGVRTGWLHAPILTMDEETVVAEGGVAAQFETTDGVWGIDAESLSIKRVITGRSLLVDEDGDDAAAIPAGAVRAERSEDVHIEASFVREARYDTFYASGVFRAARLNIDAALRASRPDDPAPDERAALNAERETRLSLLGKVSASMKAYEPGIDGADPADVRVLLQSWDLNAEEAVLVRHPSTTAPFTLTAKRVAKCNYLGGGVTIGLKADELKVDGDLRALEKTPVEGEPVKLDLTGSSVVATGDVDMRYKSAPDQPEITSRGGERFTLEDGERGQLVALPGKRVHATGVLPGESLPYRMTASVVNFTRETLDAEIVEIRPVDPVRLASLGGAKVQEIRADRMSATKEIILLDGNVHYVSVAKNGPPIVVEIEKALSLDPRTLKRDKAAKEKKEGGASKQTIGPFDPVPPQEQDEPEPKPGRDMGTVTVNFGDRGYITASSGIPIGTKLRLGKPIIDLFGFGLYFEAETLTVDAGLIFGATDDFTFVAESGKIEGETSTGPWTFTFASMDAVPMGDEVLITVVAPEVTVGADTARADYMTVWIDRARWQARGKNVTTGEDVSVGSTDAADAAAREHKPNFLAELLFELQSEEYAKYVRALFMEGGVEIARADRRAARGSRLYINLQKAAAWLQDAELVYPLQTSGQEVPLRVRTERLETDEEGRLVANGATLTTCDHDIPHFVVRTQEFSLEPRSDGRWRFGAKGNRLKFHQGLQIPLPSIGNLVLDEEFGVEGFENEAGEVTPLRDIGVARTARFGTVLGAAFRFDIGDFGKWIGEKVGMDTSNIRGKWDTEAQYLGSRGPLLGLGLSLRERKPGDDADEDFRLDAFFGGIPDGGRDRGTVRVLESERDELRLWGYLRSRYPIVRGEWIDVAVATQTDAGIQAEFYEGDFLRFEQRDTFVRWRKSFGADFLAAGAQKRIDDYRSQKEELPSFLAYRGERSVGRFTGSPVLWGGSFEAGYFTRREGEFGRDLFSDLPLGAGGGIGNFETGRANLRQRLSLPVTTQIAGIKATPFLDARGTAWTSGLVDGNDPLRAALKGGVELSTTLHKVTEDGYLHALSPRVSVSADAWYQETGVAPIPLDRSELPFDGTEVEAGFRAVWLRPGTFENLDLDVKAILRQDRENGLPDTTEVGTLAEYITRYGDGEGQIGLRHDGRYDMDSSETIYSRSALAFRPNDAFLFELRYSQARAINRLELFETAAAVGRWRVDPKWEIEARYVQDLQNDQQLLTEGTLRRFAHDFVFDITFQDRSGEGGTNISFSLLPLLGWARGRLGMLDR